MKRILIVCCAIFVALAGRAQSSSWTDPTGAQFDFTITDPVNKLAKITKGNGAPGTTVITVPGTVPYNGDTYKVTDIAGRVTWVNNHVYNNGLKKLILSENIKVLRSYSVDLNFDLEEIVFPSTLEVIGSEACTHLHSLKGVDLSHTKVKYIDYGAFNANLSQISYIKFPQTLRRLDFGICIQSNPPLKKLELPAQLDTLSYGTFNGLYQLEEISFTKPTPALLYTTNPVNPSYGPYNPFRDLTNLQVVHLPVDATAAYKSQPYWADGANLYREEVKIGASGYATLYLANENFEVPTGCEAFVIESIVPSATPGERKKANAKKFVAGSIIPAGQAVILKGTAGQTYEYKANVSGTPVTIAQNLLVGTATEQTLNAPGYKYFLFGSGPNGQGFYRQTGHDIGSIHLKAHKAGLRIPASVAGSAKAFTIDFDEAEDGSVTAIRDIETDNHRPDIIYNLQGQRVTRPEKGIYIVNGKKKVY